MLKSIKIATAMILTSSVLSAVSSESDAEIRAKYKEMTACEQIHFAAKKIMEMRQNNAPMHVLMNSMGKQEFVKKMIIDAYESTSAFSTKEFKQDAIEEFANKYALECYKKGE